MGDAPLTKFRAPVEAARLPRECEPCTCHARELLWVPDRRREGAWIGVCRRWCCGAVRVDFYQGVALEL